MLPPETVRFPLMVGLPVMFPVSAVAVMVPFPVAEMVVLFPATMLPVSALVVVFLYTSDVDGVAAFSTAASTVAKRARDFFMAGLF